MKIRNGFVSNSSSSSFCILGVQTTQEEYDKVCSMENTTLNTECGINEWDNSVYVGFNPEGMKDDETLLQFKTRLIEEMKKAGLTYKIEDLYWKTDGGYNG
jgi:hypothetical protein